MNTQRFIKCLLFKDRLSKAAGVFPIINCLYLGISLFLELLYPSSSVFGVMGMSLSRHEGLRDSSK